MKQTPSSEFSWSVFFFVTAGSFFIFSLLLKLLDGAHAHVGLFFKTALVTLGLGILFSIHGLVVGKDK